jgi:hypothetical protein
MNNEIVNTDNNINNIIHTIKNISTEMKTLLLLILSR